MGSWVVLHQINSLQKVFIRKQFFFFLNKLITGKTPFFVIVPFCTPHAICLNTDLLKGSFA